LVLNRDKDLVEIMSFRGKPVKGVLLDITGVLLEDGKAIQGSVEAVQKLKNANIDVRFVTNETQLTRNKLVEKLHGQKFTMPEEAIFPPALAMASIIHDKALKPYFLVHPNCLEDLGPTATQDETGTCDYNCVVMGDAVDLFSYRNLNKAFQLIMKTGCPLYALGKGKYYQDCGELTLDVGSFTALLEFATEKSAIIVGKPSKDFFHAALNDMGIGAEQAIMVGDDIVSDVGGAQSCGLAGILVRTGKYRQSDENHPKVKPDKIVDNLAEIVNILLGSSE